MRERIEGEWALLREQIPEGMDLDEAMYENPDLANEGAELLVLMRKEQDYLAAQGVDPRPYDRYQPKF
jgi:hypothetical protein